MLKGDFHIVQLTAVSPGGNSTADLTDVRKIMVVVPGELSVGLYYFTLFNNFNFYVYIHFKFRKISH